jgi:hypothetical protein
MRSCRITPMRKVAMDIWPRGPGLPIRPSRRRQRWHFASRQYPAGRIDRRRTNRSCKGREACPKRHVPGNHKSGFRRSRSTARHRFPEVAVHCKRVNEGNTRLAAICGHGIAQGGAVAHPGMRTVQALLRQRELSSRSRRGRSGKMIGRKRPKTADDCFTG